MYAEASDWIAGFEGRLQMLVADVTADGGARAGLLAMILLGLAALLALLSRAVDEDDEG